MTRAGWRISIYSQRARRRDRGAARDEQSHHRRGVLNPVLSGPSVLSVAISPKRSASTDGSIRPLRKRQAHHPPAPRAAGARRSRPRARGRPGVAFPLVHELHARRRGGSACWRPRPRTEDAPPPARPSPASPHALRQSSAQSSRYRSACWGSAPERRGASASSPRPSSSPSGAAYISAVYPSSACLLPSLGVGVGVANLAELGDLPASSISPCPPLFVCASTSARR